MTSAGVAYSRGCLPRPSNAPPTGLIASRSSSKLLEESYNVLSV